MPSDDFWMNLRTAVRFLSPRASTDAPDGDAAALEQRLKNAAFWLTPGSVDGFDPADFDFLDKGDLALLRRNVESFRRVAASVPGDRPATKQQLEEAAVAFGE